MQDPFNLDGQRVEALALWNGVAVELLPTLPSEIPMSLLGFVKESWRHAVYFTRAGQAFTIAAVRAPWRVTALSKLLSNTFYNPHRVVLLQLSAPRPYLFSELQTAISAAVAADDDGLTQFVERNDLLSRIAEATDFSALIEVLIASQTEPEGPTA